MVHASGALVYIQALHIDQGLHRDTADALPLQQVKCSSIYAIVATAVFEDVDQLTARPPAAAAAGSKPKDISTDQAPPPARSHAQGTDKSAAGGADDVILTDRIKSVLEQPVGKTHMIVFNPHVRQACLTETRLCSSHHC